MLIVLSPAKTLDFESPIKVNKTTEPDFIPRSAELVSTLRSMPPAEIGSLMSISDSLAQLNVARYASWSKKFTADNSRPAVLAFDGDVYEGQWRLNVRHGKVCACACVSNTVATHAMCGTHISNTLATH